jgi:hypothetical protein
MKAEKLPDTKFDENPLSGLRVVTYERADRQTDMAKLIDALLQLFCEHA